MFLFTEDKLEELAAEVWNIRADAANHEEGSDKLLAQVSWIQKPWAEITAKANDGDEFMQMLVQSHIESTKQFIAALNQIWIDG